MKKGIFTLLFALTFTWPLFAAPKLITITASNLFNGTTPKEGIDSLAYINPAAVFPSFAAATNHTWDLTGLAYSGYGAKIRYRADGNFRYGDSLASVLDSVHYWVHALNAYNLQSILQTQLQVDSQTNYITTPGGWVDTFIIPYQVIPYINKPQYLVMPFPATYKTNWASSFAYSTYLNLTDSNLLLRKVTAYRRTYVTETDSVIGWGSMKVNTTMMNASHKLIPSAGNNVLQIQIIRHEIDTFNINNPTLYTNMHISPAYVTSTYQQDYYCLGSVTPLARILFTDSTFTKVQSATINTSVISVYPERVNNIANENEIRVYPNPVANGSTISIDMPETAGDWSYELVNAAGRVQAASPFTLNGTHAAISVQDNVIPGIYFLRLINNGQQAAVKVLQVK